MTGARRAGSRHCEGRHSQRRCVRSKRVITLANQSDFISFRHHVFEKPRGAKSVELKEVGPRFEMRLFQIKLGTMEQQEAESEWSLRPYMRSGKKAKLSCAAKA